MSRNCQEHTVVVWPILFILLMVLQFQQEYQHKAEPCPKCWKLSGFKQGKAAKRSKRPLRSLTTSNYGQFFDRTIPWRVGREVFNEIEGFSKARGTPKLHWDTGDREKWPSHAPEPKWGRNLKVNEVPSENQAISKVSLQMTRRNRGTESDKTVFFFTKITEATFLWTLSLMLTIWYIE